MTMVLRADCSKLLLFAALISASSCSSERACTMIGCDSGAFMSITYLSPPAGLVGGTMTVCRNDVCQSGTVPSLHGQSVSFGEAANARASLSQDVNGMLTIRMEWRESGQVNDGDHYVVTLVDAAGNASTLVDKTVTYEKLAPNGEECGPVCWQAQL